MAIKNFFKDLIFIIMGTITAWRLTHRNNTHNPGSNSLTAGKDDNKAHTYRDEYEDRNEDEYDDENVTYDNDNHQDNDDYQDDNDYQDDDYQDDDYQDDDN